MRYNKNKFNKIAVLMGGDSQERSISLISGRAVVDALRKRGHKVCACLLDSCRALTIRQSIAKFMPDAVFIALHGGAGEDGRVQAILEKMRIPYTGSGPQASYNAMNKVVSHRVFKERGIPAADYIVVKRRGGRVPMNFRSYPCVVKPVSQGSSVGLSIVKARGQLKRAVALAQNYGNKIIIAEYIPGREITVGILDDEPLPVLEIVPGRDFYDFKAKYRDKRTKYVVPAHIDENISKKIRAMAKKAHVSLKCNYFSRVDMRLNEHKKPYVLEVNTIPGLTTNSLLPKAASAAGYSFCDLCEKILNSACLTK